MKLLFDTHALIWFATDDSHLPRMVRSALEDPSNSLFVSAASAWEITAKYRKGKLQEAALLVAGWTGILAHYGVSDLPVTSAHAFRAGLLNLENADPFDRMIVAQALMESLVVVSNEAAWDRLGVTRLWRSAT